MLVVRQDFGRAEGMLTAVTLAALPLRKGMQRWVIFCQCQAFTGFIVLFPHLGFCSDHTNHSSVQEF